MNFENEMSNVIIPVKKRVFMYTGGGGYTLFMDI